MKTVDCASAGQGRRFFDEARAHDRPVVLGRAGPGPHRRGRRRPVAGASIDRAAGLSHPAGCRAPRPAQLSWGNDPCRVPTAPKALPSLRPPSIDRMASWPALAPLIARAGRPLVIEALRAWADARRGTPEVADEAACARWCEARLAGLVQPSQRPRLQPHRHGAAHQSRPRAAGRGGDRGGGRGHALADDAGIRPRRRRRAASATTTSRPGCCRLTGAEAATAVNNNAAAVLLVLNALADGPRGDRLARRADRDRRRLPHSRHHGARRLPPGRGRHHQPHASQGLCRGDRPGHRGDHEGPSLELRHRRASPSRCRRPSWCRWRARRACR